MYFINLRANAQGNMHESYIKLRARYNSEDLKEAKDNISISESSIIKTHKNGVINKQMHMSTLFLVLWW